MSACLGVGEELVAVCARTGSVHSTRWRRVRVVARPYGRPLVPPVRTRDGVIMLRVLADFVAVYCIASEVRWKLLFCKVAWSLSISDGRQARPHSVDSRARCAIYTASTSTRPVGWGRVFLLEGR